MNSTVPLDRAELRLGSSTDTSPSRLEREERHLRLAPRSGGRTRRAPLSPLVGALLAVGIVLAIFAVQLGLSIMISQGAYETRALQVEQRDLMRVERVLQQNVDKLASPQNLAENAAGLGMVQNSHPATLRLSDSTVLGDLDSPTEDAAANVVPNSTLESMPVVDADGLLVPRGAAGEADDAAAQAPPVPWKGKLPAPATH